MLSTTMLAMASRTSTVALPRCGVSTTLGMVSSAASTSGSCSKTSSPAPAIAGLQSAHQRLLVDDRPARGVDEERGLFHERKLARADQMARLR